jgi:hypothetical protein
MTILVLGFAAAANATVMGTGDLLGGVGGVDTSSEQNAWTLTVHDSDSLAEFYSSAYVSSHYSTALYGAASGQSANYGDWAQMQTTFSTVANRAHQVHFRGLMPTTSTSRVYVGINGTEQALTVKEAAGYFSRTTWSYTAFDYAAQAGSGSATYSVLLRNQLSSSRSVLTGLYVDDVVVYRELATPQVTSQSLSVLGAGLTANITLGNAGGTLSDMLIAYDPDATVTWLSGAAATVNSLTWNSDNELVANITAGGGAGEAVFSVSNPYGEESDTFTVNITPEPTTMSLVLLGTAGILFRRRK